MIKVGSRQDCVDHSFPAVQVTDQVWNELADRDHVGSLPIDLEVLEVIASYRSLPILDPRPIEEIINDVNG